MNAPPATRMTPRRPRVQIELKRPAARAFEAGGGNAALCAALAARRAGASVLVLEVAPKDLRGGNSRHTRNFRCMHNGPAGPLTGAYPEA